MSKYIHGFDTNTNFDEYVYSENYEEPFVSLTKYNENVDYNYTYKSKQEYFTLEAVTSGTLY